MPKGPTIAAASGSSDSAESLSSLGVEESVFVALGALVASGESLSALPEGVEVAAVVGEAESSTGGAVAPPVTSLQNRAAAGRTSS